MTDTTEDIRKIRDQEELTLRLIALTAEWNEHEDVPKSQQYKCRAIGEALHELGGMDMMVEAYRDVHRLNRAATVVQAYWDGIGDWQW